AAAGERGTERIHRAGHSGQSYFEPMGIPGPGGDLHLVWGDHASAAGDEAQRDLLLCAAAGPGAGGVLEDSVSAAVLERPDGELPEEWAGSLSCGFADSAGVGVQRGGGEPRECLGADAAAAVGGQVDGEEGRV